MQRTIMRINETLSRFEEYSYPLTSEQLIEAVGDDEINHPKGRERLADVFDRPGAETFDCAEDVRLTLLSALDSGAVGRKGYSDRDPPSSGESWPGQSTL